MGHIQLFTEATNLYNRVRNHMRTHQPCITTLHGILAHVLVDGCLGYDQCPYIVAS